MAKCSELFCERERITNFVGVDTHLKNHIVRIEELGKRFLHENTACRRDVHTLSRAASERTNNTQETGRANKTVLQVIYTFALMVPIVVAQNTRQKSNLTTRLEVRGKDFWTAPRGPDNTTDLCHPMSVVWGPHKT